MRKSDTKTVILLRNMCILATNTTKNDEKNHNFTKKCMQNDEKITVFTPNSCKNEKK